MTDEIDCTGTINGITPIEMVTLTSDQFIPGTTTFRHLEVTETLEVNFCSAFRLKSVEFCSVCVVLVLGGSSGSDNW